jgi:hypothetical protein
MAPLTLLFTINVIIFFYVILKKNFSPLWVSSVKHIGLLIFVLGILGTLIGFLQMFDALESIKESVSLQIIAGGVKVALLTIIYGAGYFCISQAGYILLRILKPKTTS